MPWPHNGEGDSPTVPDPPPSGRIRVASTGKEAEDPLTIPVHRSGSHPEVVLSLGQNGQGPHRLPDLEPGDILLISAEVEVTTDCKQKQADCVKDPYTYDPEVEVGLIVADSKNAAENKEGHAKVLKKQKRKVTHRRHHDVFVFDDVEFAVPEGGLPWSGPTFVNVAVSAQDPKASNNDIVLIGQNELKDGRGVAVGDMSGISVIRSRPGDTPRPEVIRNDRRRAESLPVVKGETRIVYSQELKDLKKGEQLVVKADIETSADHLEYPARATVEVILAEKRDEDKPGAEGRRITATDGRVCPRNGKNCLDTEKSMISSKTGVVRIEKNAKKDEPMYVHAVLDTGNPTREDDPRDELRIRDGGSLRTFRYPPEMAG